MLLTHGHPDHTTDVLQAYHARQYGRPSVRYHRSRCGPPRRRSTGSWPSRRSSTNRSICSAIDRVTRVSRSVPHASRSSRWRTRRRPSVSDSSCNGVIVAFSSDTGDGADFESLAGDADVFVCEATSQDSDEIWEGHLRASQAGSIAAARWCEETDADPPSVRAVIIRSHSPKPAPRPPVSRSSLPPMAPDWSSHDLRTNRRTIPARPSPCRARTRFHAQRRGLVPREMGDTKVICTATSKKACRGGSRARATGG